MRTRVRLLTAAIGAATLSACAPDAWQNVRAQEFNAYLDVVTAKCQPLWINGTLYTSFEPSVGPAGQYDQVLDLLSRLFYQRISPAGFRNELPGAADDTRTAASADCIIAQLPGDRPKKPTGQW